MTIHFRLSLLAAGVLFLGLSCSKTIPQVAQPQQQKQQPSVSENTYTNSKFGYQISYPKQFTVLDSLVENADLALEYPKSFTEGTNLSEAKIIVAALVGSEITDGAKCLTNPYTGVPLTESVTQDGQKFYIYNIDDAGAGQRYNYRAYQTLHASNCYTILLQLHSSAIENYDPSMKIKAFDDIKVNAEFEKIFQTFKFLN